MVDTAMTQFAFPLMFARWNGRRGGAVRREAKVSPSRVALKHSWRYILKMKVIIFHSSSALKDTRVGDHYNDNNVMMMRVLVM